jgi:hypothetical protein
MLDGFPIAGDRDDLAAKRSNAMNRIEPESGVRDESGTLGRRSTDRHLARAWLTKGHSAVRATKRPRLSDGAPWQKHELFASPPWATRTLFEQVMPVVLGRRIESGTVIAEPAAGLGHMSEVIGEYTDRVLASDIYHYPCEVAIPRIMVADFLDPSWPGSEIDWIITNPPFGLSHAFLDRALCRARHGVALLQRMQWLEGQHRYRDIFLPRPPALLAPFSERVPMCEGGWDPKCGTATMYAWFIWRREDGKWPAPLGEQGTLPTYLIPPGRKEAMTSASDAALAARCVPGFFPPSQRRKRGKRRSVEIGAS